MFFYLKDFPARSVRKLSSALGPLAVMYLGVLGNPSASFGCVCPLPSWRGVRG